MSIAAIPQVEYYYDSHPTEEDLMGQNALHAVAIRYENDVLDWMYRAEGWYVAMDLNIYKSLERTEYPLAPDIAVFKGVKRWTDPRDAPKSWPIKLPGHPPPQVVIEIASDSTSGKDQDFKPDEYAAMGVAECYFFDPRPDRPPGSLALRGWNLGPGGAHEVTADAHGRIWSDELESWLEPDGELLRFYDAQGHLRLTAEEAAVAREKAAVAREKAAIVREQAERREKEAAIARAEIERSQSERLKAILRSHGIDPDA